MNRREKAVTRCKLARADQSGRVPSGADTPPDIMRATPLLLLLSRAYGHGSLDEPITRRGNKGCTPQPALTPRNRDC